MSYRHNSVEDQVIAEIDSGRSQEQTASYVYTLAPPTRSTAPLELCLSARSIEIIRAFCRMRNWTIKWLQPITKQ